MKALHAVQRVYLVPDKDVPVSPFEVAVKVRLVEHLGKYLGMWGVGRFASIVAAQVKDLGLCVTDVAKNLCIQGVPAIVPLGLPVVCDVVSNLVVPDNFQVQIHNGYVKVRLSRIIQMQLRQANTGS